jgi:RND family efflux transporter MFP subunit
VSATDLAKLHISRDDKSFSAAKRPKRWRKWAVIALIVVFVLAGFLWRATSAPLAIETATVSTAFPAQGFTVLNATGRVSAQRKAAISTKATGRLEWLGVQEGSRVKAGEVIARLEALDVGATKDSAMANARVARANLEQGEAELRDAESSLKRAQELYDKKFIAEAALDTARARYDKARANISSLNASIGVADANVRSAGVSVEQTLIRAPFDGVVLTKNANVGDIITPFSSAVDSKGAVVSMADMDTLEVEADVSEASIGKIKVGMPTEIQLDAFPEVRLLGEVSRIVPTVDRAKATVLVKVSFRERDPRVLPDMSAKVAFLQRAPNADERKAVLAVRADAIARRGEQSVLYAIDAKNVAREVPQKAARKLGDLVEVDGVKAGDKVVLSPPEKLKDGATVAIARK